MKMSKLGVFNTPIHLRGNTIGHQWGDYAKFSSEVQAKAAAHAINNHDRLHEENAKLRQMLKYAVKVANDQNATYTAIEILNIEVQQLLSQLKDKNNDK